MIEECTHNQIDFMDLRVCGCLCVYVVSACIESLKYSLYQLSNDDHQTRLQFDMHKSFSQANTSFEIPRISN